MRAARLAILITAAAALLGPAAARADIIAATEVANPAPNTFDTDIALVDATRGAQFGLPAGINTPQEERHPSITPDGNRLAYERFDVFTDTVRIIVVDLTSGQQADLFNAFETAQFRPTTPTITPDGQTVLTGTVSVPNNGGNAVAFTRTSWRTSRAARSRTPTGPS